MHDDDTEQVGRTNTHFKQAINDLVLQQIIVLLILRMAGTIDICCIEVSMSLAGTCRSRNVEKIFSVKVAVSNSFCHPQELILVKLELADTRIITCCLNVDILLAA